MLHLQEIIAEHPLHVEPELVGHARQVMRPVAAMVSEYVPDPQLVHAAEPLEILYFPATQFEHTPPSGPVYPALQVQPVDAEQPVHDAPELAGHVRQVVATVAPTVAEYVPVPQSVHVALPVTLLYFPAAQVEHTPPSGPVYPTLQVQAVRALLLTGESELVGHVRQVVATVAPTVVEYVPTPQAVHSTEPVALS